MAEILLLPFGSAGDVFPFIWLGRQLMARGHRVRMITACLFEEQARKAGIEFISLGDRDEFEAMIRDPRIWKSGIGTKVVFDFAAKSVVPYLAAIESCGKVDLMLAPVTAFAGRLAREKHGIPLITVHLQPAVFLSVHETPLLHPAMRLFNMLPIWFKKLVFSLPNPVDLFALPKVRRICEANGVKPPRSLWREWWDSPDGVLALFPAWFAQPQPDWPANLLQWTFPLEDLASEQALQPELQAFLASGERPVVFTPGSANVQASRFFAVAAEAVKRIGCRAVFVTREPKQVPPNLPADILTVEYAPFSTLLKYAAVFVHHGGIGTMSQGFAAAVPQLIMAMAHDQPDNANRLERLGAGTGLSVRQFTPERVAHELKQLLQGVTVRQAALGCAAKLRQAPSFELLLTWIESTMKPSIHVA
ncbi:MAG: glycosyltransferase [Prosthecobacter sp.]|uniref:glycosyltransferase n=1 Tax=Prosthecobacter sp. TaxID=1965333 RepID=UPI0025ED730C|nr:glycosyltransferase [Prosthecobacter sp.]MCF7786126.1 glycosyltransferase [Prosthecobacter sp.]